MMNRRKLDVIIHAVLIIMSIIVLTNDNLVEGGMETALGSMFLPRLIAVCIIAFSGTIGAQSLYKLRKALPLEEQEFIDTNGFMGIVVYIAYFLIYWYMVPIVGFIVATPFIMIAVALLLGSRNWLVMLPLSIVTPILIYYGCYNYLRVLLPTWSL
ncbi:tripartite tricarboxylate transporter TctB family protein [Desulfotalea psychrophila]|uniref:DUF1468 domain-containing protein n=1 Tax=Desulfotalea psychrophila (strain LSv54 / DSM 12343) TaxID=177439 RepID=Q6AL01_DESPS|nr:tripartite tricarboxylate transporter TctB family protein [Desulfotalea psychrophila]CAG36974.1 unknown protein [Desulfotalea psychrophila LSv54]